MTVTYTTEAIVKKRVKDISSDLLTADIEQHINEAESFLDCAMRHSFISSFDTSKHQILRKAATELTAFTILIYDVTEYTNLPEFGATMETLWYSIERILAFLEDERTVEYLKSLG